VTTSVTPQHADLVIVGEGILGRVAALLARKRLPRSKRIVVVAERTPTGAIPSADTHRNHCWLQSGMLYGGNALLAAHMLTSGRALHREVGLTLPQNQGIFRIGEEHKREILETAQMLGLQDSVHVMARHAAQSQLGQFYEPGYAHFTVPDAPFDEPRVMAELRTQAQLLGVEWMHGRVSLKRVGGDSVVVVTDPDSQETIQIEAPCVVLCAGSGNVELLDSIGVLHELVVYQSGLIRIYDDRLMRTCLLADRTKQLSVVGFPAGGLHAHGCTVIGGGEKVRVSAARLRSRARRRLSGAEIENLWRMLPRDFRHRHEGNARFTVGYKTEMLTKGAAGSTVDSSVREASELRNLVYAVPGKATLAYHCANHFLMPEILGRTRGAGIRKSTRLLIDRRNADVQQAELPFHHSDSFKEVSED
jgi:glycine/D-amino acid oxidase-like deaminating enzyme